MTEPDRTLLERWEPSVYFSFVCGVCGEGLFLDPQVTEEAIDGYCRTRGCRAHGLVVRIYPPEEKP